MIRTIAILLFFTLQSFAQSDREVIIDTYISEVTVYRQGALITRSGKTFLTTGKSTIRLISLSPYIDEKSIQVKATGDFTIISVNHKLNYLDELQKTARTDSLMRLIELLDKKIAAANSRIEVLGQKESLLDENKLLGGNAGTTLSQLKEALAFYDREITAIKEEQRNSYQDIKEWEEEKNRLTAEVDTHIRKKEVPTGEIQIRVESQDNIEGLFEVSYFVRNTGWYPKYDIRVKGVADPLLLSYKADVYQNTGVDWSNVNLKLSNGDPNQSGVAPELTT